MVIQMNWNRSACLCLALTTSACGGGFSPAGAASDASASSTGAGTGGGGGTGTGGSGGGADDRIDPILLGHAWTYDVQELGSFPLCPAGTHTGEVLGESTVDGKDAFEVSSLCANAGSSYYAVDGDVVQVDYQGTWLLALDAPVEEGHTWSNGSSTFTWHSKSSVTVPAGTFSDCWSATQNVAYEAYTIFCRGVGPVRWYSKDLDGNGFDAQLTAKSF
jgi:hypothetical protein